MPANKNTEPAFPVYYYDTQPDTGIQVVREHYYGLTKREHFAAEALKGILSNPALVDNFSSRATLAKETVYLAYALIEELAK